jgi:hypothetical protein
MPDWKTELRKQLSGLRLTPTREAEIVNELAEHLESRYEELLATGVSPSEAERVIRSEISESDQLANELQPIERQERPSLNIPGDSRFHLFGDLWQDVRHACFAGLSRRCHRTRCGAGNTAARF